MANAGIAISIDARPATIGAKSLVGSLDRIEKKLDILIRNMKKSQAVNKKTGDSFKKVGKDAKQASLGMKVLNSTITKLALGYLALNIALDAVSDIAQFEKTLKEIEAATNESVSTLKKAEERIRELGKSSVFTAKQVADAFLVMSRAGLSVQESMDGLKPVLDLAIVGNLTMAEATSIAVSQMRTFGRTADEIVDIVDDLTTGAFAADTTIRQLSNAFGFSSAISSSLGVSFTDMTAALVALADAGQKGGKVGRNLRTIFLVLAGNITPKLQKELDALGLTVKDLDFKSRPALDILRDFEPVFKDAARAGALFNREAVSVAASLGVEGVLDKMKEMTEEFENNADAAKKASDIMQDSLIPQLKTLRGVFVETLLILTRDSGGTSGLTNIIKLVIFLLTLLNNVLEVLVKIFNVTINIGKVLFQVSTGFSLKEVNESLEELKINLIELGLANSNLVNDVSNTLGFGKIFDTTSMEVFLRKLSDLDKLFNDIGNKDNDKKIVDNIVIDEKTITDFKKFVDSMISLERQVNVQIELAANVGLSNQAFKRLEATLKAETEAMNSSFIQTEEQAKAFIAAKIAVFDFTEETKELKSIEKLTKNLQKENIVLQALVQAMNDGVISTEDLNEEFDDFNKLLQVGIDLGSEEAESLLAMMRANRELIKSIEEGIPVIRTWQDGLKDGFDILKEELSDTGQITEDVFLKTFDIATDTMEEFFTTGRLSIESFSEDMLRMFNKLAAQQILLSAISSGASLFSGGGALGGIPSNTGNIFTQNSGPNLSGFAHGGIATRPSLFAESGPEAAVPLPDGRRIPVELKNGNIQPIIINFNINTPDAASFGRSKNQIINKASNEMRRAVSRSGAN